MKIVHVIRVALILATAALWAGSYFPTPSIWAAASTWNFAFAGLSGAIALYATITIVTLAIAFGATAKKIGDSDTPNAPFGQALLLLFVYPLYRIALVLAPLSLMFFFLNRAAPGAYFEVPAAENTPLGFMHRTSEALFLQLFPNAAIWPPSGIQILGQNPWSNLLMIAMMGAPVAAVVEVVRSWIIALVLLPIHAISLSRAKKRAEDLARSRRNILSDVDRHQYTSGSRLASPRY